MVRTIRALLPMLSCLLVSACPGEPARDGLPDGGVDGTPGEVSDGMPGDAAPGTTVDGASGTSPDASEPGCTLVTDSDARPRPDLPRPAYLESYIDPLFGSRVTRITGDPGTPIVTAAGETIGTWPEICRHEYSKVQSWNADQSLIWLQWCGLFLDGATYRPLRLSSPPHTPGGDYARWHPTDPRYLVYVYYNQLGKWDPRTGEDIPITTFSDYSSSDLLSIGPGEGNLSRDGRMIALYAPAYRRAFAYDLVNDVKHAEIDLSWTAAVDWVSISADGDFVVANIAGDNTVVYDLDGQQVGSTWSEYACPSHYDLTIDDQGNPVAVGVCKLSEEYAFVKRNLVDGARVNIGVQASHTSARNIFRPSVVYASNPWEEPYLNEVLAIKLDGSRIERLAWIPNLWDDYPTEPHALPSPDGMKVIIASNWSLAARPVSTFVIELCPN